MEALGLWHVPWQTRLTKAATCVACDSLSSEGGDTTQWLPWGVGRWVQSPCSSVQLLPWPQGHGHLTLLLGLLPRLLPHGPSSFHLSNPASPSCPGPRHVLSPRREPRPGACLRQRRLHPARSRLLCPSSRPPSRRHCLKLNGLPVYGPFFSTRTEALLACSCYISRVSTVTVTEQGLSPYRVGERGNRRPG